VQRDELARSVLQVSIRNSAKLRGSEDHALTLRNRTYRHLFLAQIASLLGTGLATVGLSLLASELARASAGAVLGAALAIKMIAYVGVAPIASVIAERFPRRALLIALDLVRAAIMLVLPFVDQICRHGRTHGSPGASYLRKNR
jgi:MFS family permease